MTERVPTHDGVPPVPSPPLPADAWRRVLVVMEKLAFSSNLDEILSIVIDAMRDCLDADRASVFQYDAARGELIAAQAHGVGPSLRIPVSRGLAGEAVRSREIINVPDCRHDTRFNPEVDLRTGYTTRSMLTVPLVSFDGIVEGVAQVLNKRAANGGAGPFLAIDEELARGLASQAAVAIRRARLIEAERRKTKIEADLRIARDIQFAALPASLPIIPGYDIAAQTIPAEETGGDIFDVVALPCDGTRTPEFLLLVADAAGHGVGPALAVTKLQAMLRMSASLCTPLREALECINRQLCESLPIGRYVAAVVGVFNPASHRVHTFTAGLSSAYMIDRKGNVGKRNADALALAIEPEWAADTGLEEEIPLGGALVILTDGYPEARDRSGAMFGMEGVEASLIRAVARAATEKRPAHAVLQSLESDMNDFVRGEPAADDRTAIVVFRRIE
jgi:phosphoserine phosphatase RsbU/P